MSRCIFCDIVSGGAEASLIHEDAYCSAFLDLYPITPGHALVIPRRHAVHLHELPQAERDHLFAVGYQVLEAQRSAGIGWAGANLFLNDGPASGQHVPHVHLHLLPRRQGDGRRTLIRFLARVASLFGRPCPRSELDELARRVRSGFSPPD